MVEFKGVVYKRSKNTVIDNVQFELETGETTALIGPNGAGKTTIMKLILGLIFPQKGDIFIDDIKLTKNNRYTLVSRMGLFLKMPLIMILCPFNKILKYILCYTV